MIKTIDVVIGANYGDEGKGLTVARIAKNYDPSNTICIMNNGGSQRGHSVVYPEGSHTFKHFNSATPQGVASFYGRDFILNPMQWVKEWLEISVLFKKTPAALRDYRCLWTTPWDMMANQIQQKECWTGSCGMGIWFTIRRSKFIHIPLDEFMTFSHQRKVDLLKFIKTYYEQYFKLTIPKEYREAWESENTIEHFIKDCKTFLKNTASIIHIDAWYNAWDHIIIENGQGILLGDKGKDDIETTPSKTGAAAIPEYLKNNYSDIIALHYVTRPYITRHGSKNWSDVKIDCDLKKDLEINQFNEWQRDLKYGNLDLANMKANIEYDGGLVAPNNVIVEVTHCDELDREAEFKKYFEKVNFYDTNLLK